jgi:hypothetical protein
MPNAKSLWSEDRRRTSCIRTLHLGPQSARRDETEQFIHTIFQRRYAADITVSAPRLLMLEQHGRVIAGAGWRGADGGALFLERYLDAPIEAVLGTLTGQPLARRRIVEVGNLAAEKPGLGPQVILSLARHLDQSGYEWVVFTATQELIGIFTKLGLPLLALVNADPDRLGDAARDWGSYYDTGPVVVAGRIRLALDKIGGKA